MYNKVFGLPTTSGIRGTHYVEGSAYVYFIQTSSFGLSRIMRIRVTPVETVRSGSLTIAASSQGSIDLDGGLADIQWSGSIQQLNALYSVKIHNYSGAPASSLENVDPNSLPSLAYAASATPFPEDGKGDNYYAAQLGSGNYAVFRIYQDPADATQVKIDWITYKLNANPESVGFLPLDARDLVIADDFSFAYVSGVNPNTGEGHIYKILNQNLDLNGKPDFTSFNPELCQLDTAPLADPKQIGSHDNLVYVIDDTGLSHIDPNNGAQQRIVSSLTGGTGLLIDDVEGKAYLTDGTGGIFVVDLAQANPTLTALSAPLSPLPGPTGFLRWADPARTAFFAPILDPDNKVLRVDLVNQMVTALIDPSPTNPWSVEVLSDARLFLASDMELGDISLSLGGTALMLGIGLVPFDYIIQTAGSTDRGKADTTTAPGYFYQVHKTPFGGRLNLMINHKEAWNKGHRYYRVTRQKIDGSDNALDAKTAVTTPFNDFKWSSLGGFPKFWVTSTMSSGLTPTAPVPPESFEVRDPDDLWYNPYLGAILATRATDTGLLKITVEFFDQNGDLVPEDTQSYVLLIDNTYCNASLELPRVGSPPPDTYPQLDCGCLPYASKDDKVEIDFTAWHPSGYGVYSIHVYRGGVHLPALAQSGAVDMVSTLNTKSTTTLPSSPTFKVGHIIGNCNVATVRVRLSITPRAIDGYRWVNYVGARDRIFTLVPDTTSMSTPWVDPGG